MGLLANSCFVGRYSTPGGRLSRGRPWQSTPPNAPGSVSGLFKVVGDSRKSSRVGSDYWRISVYRPTRACWPKMGGNRITTQILGARIADSRSAWIAAVAIPLMLLAPALWNGYPLLQWDTGGYLARWYEGYLVPSRSTVFGLYLHFGEGTNFWTNLVLQALVTLWIIQTTLRVLGAKQRFTLVAICLLLILTTALP